jgi:hypothetical protein
VFERSLAAKAGETLTLDLDTGADVDVVGIDGSTVRVRIELDGTDWQKSIPSIERASDGVRVGIARQNTHGSFSTSNRVRAEVPKHYNVRLQSAGGEFQVRRVNGALSGTTGGGEIVLEHDLGSAHLSTGGGEIRVTECKLSGSVSTGGGTVRLIGVSGGLVGSSGSGRVFHSDGVGDDDETDGDHDAKDDGDEDDNSGVWVQPNGMVSVDKPGAASTSTTLPGARG